MFGEYKDLKNSGQPIKTWKPLERWSMSLLSAHPPVAFFSLFHHVFCFSIHGVSCHWPLAPRWLATWRDKLPALEPQHQITGKEDLIVCVSISIFIHEVEVVAMHASFTWGIQVTMCLANVGSLLPWYGHLVWWEWTFYTTYLVISHCWFKCSYGSPYPLEQSLIFSR